MNFHISKSTWAVVITIILVGSGYIWFISNFNKVYYERNVGYSTEARKNQFLAAEMFLKKLNIDIESRHDFSIFDEKAKFGKYDTAFINGSRIGMSQMRREKMHDWIKNGGHVVLLTTEFYDYDFNSSRDKFLDSLGLRYYDTSDDFTDYTEEESHTKLKFDDYSDETIIHFYDNGYIEDTSGNATFIGGTEHADQFIQYQIGDGLVSVLVDFSIFKNTRIDNHDHAIFLKQLIGQSEKAWLIYNKESLTLFSLMIKNIPLVVISFVVLLSLIIIGYFWRKGAAKKDLPAVQREIIQHIEAAGEFSYRSDNGKILFTTLIDSLDKKINTLANGYLRLTPTKQQIRLSQLTGINKKELAILWNDDNETQDAFIQKIKLIQKIRKNL